MLRAGVKVAQPVTVQVWFHHGDGEWGAEGCCPYERST